MKGINVLGLGATFAAVAGAITLSSSPAQALTLVSGDDLYGDAKVQIVGDAKTSLEFDFLDDVFTVDKDFSEGTFLSYDELAIKDVTFANGMDISKFLSYDDFYLDWNNINITQDEVKGTTRYIDIEGTAFFASTKGGNTYSGIGTATGQLRVNRGTNKVNFIFSVDKVESVPEPASVLGLLAVGMLGAGSLKRKKSS